MGNRTDHGYHPTTGNRYSSFRGDSASYDADGNFIQRLNPGNYTLNFYWSAEARLDSVEFQYVKLARYDYNALGKPVVKYTKSYGGSWAVSSYFIWDGDQLLLELDSLGNRRADYTYFPGTIDQPAAQSIGATTVTTTRDFRFDATGSVIGTVQGTGVSQKVAYSQWGGPDFTGNSDNHLMWKGLLYNEDVAGLIYMRGRWYDPAEGRFYNEDPIGHAGGENLYTFTNNDPINGSDPSGTMQCSQSYLDLGYHTSFDDMGHSWCIPGSIGGGSALPPVIVWATPLSGFSSNFGKRGGSGIPFSGFGGNGSSSGLSPIAAGRDKTMITRKGQSIQSRPLNSQCVAETLREAGHVGAGIGAFIGGVQGAAKYGPAWSSVGTFAGGILMGSALGPEMAVPGAVAGRALGYAAASLFGAHEGVEIGEGVAGVAAGVVSVLGCR